MTTRFCKGRRLLGVAAMGMLLSVLALGLAQQAGAYIYWTNTYTHTIGRANLDGSGVNQSFVGGASASDLEGLAVDGQRIFWSSSNNKIGRANLDGSSPNQSFITDSRVSDPQQLALDGSFVYWANNSPWQLGVYGTVARAGLDGSSPTIMLDTTPFQYAQGLAVDSSYVYWTEASTIGRANLDGSSPNHSFITGASAPCGLAVDSSHIYWTNNGGSAIGRADLNGSNVNQSFITSAGSPCGLAVDGSHIYWANVGLGGKIGCANLDGSSQNNSFITPAASDYAIGLAVDGLGPSGGCSGGGVTTYTLTVAKSGSGAGSVTSNPAGISCGATCSNSFNAGTSVTLTATADSGSSFTGWSGDCSGTTCTVAMNAAHSVTATFESDKTLTVAKGGSGAGSVTSNPAGINCGSTCSHAYTHGTSVTLTATADSGSSFTGWSGDCTGTTCTVAMSAAHSVTATFATDTIPPEDQALDVSTDGDGDGTVTSSPAGIDCGSICSFDFTHATVVTLTAVADAGSTFAGWSEDCSGSGTCTVTMDADHSVTATFDPLCIVPNVKGKKLAAARNAIEDANCTVGTVTKAFSSKKKGTVISQSRPPGKKLPEGAKVNLKVSKGKK